MKKPSNKLDHKLVTPVWIIDIGTESEMIKLNKKYPEAKVKKLKIKLEEMKKRQLEWPMASIKLRGKK